MRRRLEDLTPYTLNGKYVVHVYDSNGLIHGVDIDVMTSGGRHIGGFDAQQHCQRLSYKYFMTKSDCDLYHIRMTTEEVTCLACLAKGGT